MTLARAFPAMWCGQSLLARDSQVARSAGVRPANVAVVAGLGRGGQWKRRLASPGWGGGAMQCY